VVVPAVDPASPAAAAGLQRSDVIQEVNRKRIATIRQYEQALTGTGRQLVVVLVNREGTIRFLLVQRL
jgi:serine protease Do